MAILLNITDSTDTLDLANGTTAHTTEYTPRRPDDSTATWVEDEIPMYFGSTTAGRSALLDFERLMEQARNYTQKKRGSRIYLQYKPETLETTYRALVYDGTYSIAPGLHTSQWGGGFMEATLRVKRGPFEAARTQIPLTNGNGSDNTAGLTVYCHDDADSGHDNQVEINPLYVDGSLPTPIELRIVNSYNNAARLERLYVGHNVFSAPASFAHVLEGEDSTGGGTVTASASNSAGNYMARSWTGTGDVVAYRWALSSSTLNNAKGGLFRVIARLATAPVGDIWVRVKVQMAGLSDVGVPGPWVKLTPYIMQSLDSLQLPPWLPEVTSIGSLDLVLEARRDNVGTNNLNIDFVHLFALDGWRELRARGYGVQYNETLIDDRIEDRLYVLTGASAAYGHYVGSGEILLVPNKTQRLYFLQQDWLGNAAIDRTLSVRAWHRPRRWTIEV